MKVLVVCQYFSPEQFRINDICFELVKRGHDVTVLTGLPNYPSGIISDEYKKGKRRNEVINGVKVIRVPIVGRENSLVRLVLNYVTYAFNATRRIKKLDKDFDVIYVYQLSPVTMVYPARKYKRMTGAPMALYCLDLWPESIAAAKFSQDSIVYKILLKISRKLYNSADKIEVTSRSFVEYFKDIIEISDLDKVCYLPQYAEDLFNDAGNEEAKSQEKENHEAENTEVSYEKCDSASPKDIDINLVFAGNIGEMQSVETILLASNELRDIKNLKWHIVGDGSSYEKCRSLAKELKLSDNVIFHGQKPVTDMPGFYKMASAMLVTLKSNKFISYTLPGKVQSYMAAGKPIIGAIDGEADVIIKESGCGLSGPAEDYKALAENVKEFISRPDEWSGYGMRSKDYYVKNFSKDVFINKLTEDFTELVNSRK